MLQIDQNEELVTFRHEAMATELTVLIGGVDSAYASQAAHEAFACIDDLEGKLSMYQENSDVTRINRASTGDVVRVSSDCIDCLNAAMTASSMTMGLFHAFLGNASLSVKGGAPVFLNGCSTAEACVPAELPIVELNLSARSVRKTQDGPLLDLGGIGKGYALDRAMEVFDEWDVSTVLLDFGGSTLLFKSPAGTSPWSGTLNGKTLKPFEKGAISSSGLGFQGEHIVHSEQGRKCRWIRSFVRAPSAALADALSTAAMLMTQVEVEALVLSEGFLAIALEDQDGRIATDRFCAWHLK